ncbi:MAG TPA: FAD-dependent oxidoreductase, partial [Thermoplasmatales archaeon]|nr:FAD-dependent oxidoreductase [Thermoplasmatales archaeon]HEX17676.1 FAD-dependent oxidoreductase [Thermoplasmatales archaeon]
MERYDYDVIVVGGGPAGLVTSALIAERGFSVAVLERDREIGIPVLCGEGVSKKVDELGVI